MSNVLRLLNGLVETIVSLHQAKVHAGNDQEKAQSERNSHSKNPGKKDQIDNQVLILRKKNVLTASFTGHCLLLHFNTYNPP